MKKLEVRQLLALLLAAVLVFALVACGGTEDTTLPPDSGTDPEVTEPTETDPVETDPVETDPVETDPVVTDPAETDPPATEPAETDPPATEPVETDPPVTEPVETNPPETTPVSTGCEHKFGNSKRIAATCQREGGVQYTCSKCGETKVEDVIPKIDHVYVETVLSPSTCNSEGQAAYQCEFCGDTKEPHTLPASNHIIDVKVISSPSFTHCEARVELCVLCNEVQSAVPVTPHAFGSVPERVADSYTDGGFPTYGFELFTCTCGYQYRVNSNHAAGHYYVLRPEDAKYVCKCGDEVSDFTENGNPNAGPVYKQN